jgi:hypothetical protein
MIYQRLAKVFLICSGTGDSLRPDSRQAVGAPVYETEITPEMLAAGVETGC